MLRVKGVVSFESHTNTRTHAYARTHGYRAWLKWKCLMLTIKTTPENSSQSRAAKKLWGGEMIVRAGRRNASVCVFWFFGVFLGVGWLEPVRYWCFGPTLPFAAGTEGSSGSRGAACPNIPACDWPTLV